MRLFNRKPLPQPKPVALADVIKGLRTYADDLEAGDAYALEGLGPKGESPVTADQWAAYPTDFVRRVRIAYFGKPGPGDVPSAEFDQLMDELDGGR